MRCCDCRDPIEGWVCLRRPPVLVPPRKGGKRTRLKEELNTALPRGKPLPLKNLSCAHYRSCTACGGANGAFRELRSAGERTHRWRLCLHLLGCNWRRIWRYQEPGARLGYCAGVGSAPVTASVSRGLPLPHAAWPRVWARRPSGFSPLFAAEMGPAGGIPSPRFDRGKRKNGKFPKKINKL